MFSAVFRRGLPRILRGPSCRPRPIIHPSRRLASMAPFQDRSAIADNHLTSFGNFDLVKRFQLDYTDVLVSKWRSRVSGLTLVHLDYEGLCNSPIFSYTSEHFSSSTH